MDPALRSSIWKKLSPPLSSYEGYYDHSGIKSGKSDAVRKYIKATQKAIEKTNIAIPAQPVIALEDGAISYTVKSELGKGAFAPVYLVENNMVDEDDEDTQDLSGDVALKRSNLEALKMEAPPTPWEFYMTRLSHSRLGSHRAKSSLVRVHEFHLYRDEAFLIIDYHAQGSLLDLVNLTSTPNNILSTPSGTMDELLAMFFTVELLRTVETLHSNDILHGDLKADNCLVRLQTTNSDADWGSLYSRDGSDGWDRKGLTLIDFGRGIDMRVFRKDVLFIADWKTDNQDCPEMREMRPWTYQIDYYGMAAIVHTMLFGKYIETTVQKHAGGESGDAIGSKSARRYGIKNALKRYWQQEIWAEFFELMLNPMRLAADEGGMMPCTKAMKAVRGKMEDWLEENCERGVGLKGMIKKMEKGVKARGKR
jgi:checkpoint serine/threonine-protein kinase